MKISKINAAYEISQGVSSLGQIVLANGSKITMFEGVSDHSRLIHALNLGAIIELATIKLHDGWLLIHTHQPLSEFQKEYISSVYAEEDIFSGFPSVEFNCWTTLIYV